ncbi:MAG TPA: hypothetical protein VNZ52_03430 [Candidatus Thermoplasmatota archaeon]|nr:hypothetical protein [Candidatus Thermoplasmatota archaeon]
MTQDVLLRRGHGFFGLGLAVVVLSALLAGIPLVAYLALLSSVTLFALAYVNYFKCDTLKGKRWQPALALGLSLLAVALTVVAYVGVPDALQARDPEGLVAAIKRHYVITTGTLTLSAAAWFLVGTAREPGPRIKGLLTAALVIALMNGLLALVYIAPNMEARLREDFQSPEGLRAFNASTDANETASFYLNSTRDAFQPYSALRDLGDMLPRLLAVGAFYLLWDQERRRPLPGREEEGVVDVSDAFKPQS